MPRYVLPQFIESEGRIITFLTYRQFFWLVGGGAVLFIMFYALPFNIFIIPAILIAIFVAAAAFVKIDNMPILKVFSNFIGFSASSKTYIWKKGKQVYPLRMEAKTTSNSESDLKLQKGVLAETKNKVETRG